jgi:hypothetical protein
MLIFEWLDGGHVACLINFIPPPAFLSRLAAATTEGRKKNVDVRQKKAKEKERNILEYYDNADSPYRVAYEYANTKNCSMMKQKQRLIPSVSFSTLHY